MAESLENQARPTDYGANQKKPKWQLGLAIGAQDIAHYRGSDQRHTEVLPVPLLMYTGRFLKINRDGARGEFLKTDRIEINLSADASLIGRADQNRAREGMPDLDTALELGPALNIRIAGVSFDDGWALKFPFRLVATLDDEGVIARGYVFNPRLSFKKPDAFAGWNFGFTLGALWGSENNHEYYYEVGPQYARPDRPEYQADTGYAGALTRISLRRRFGDWFVGGYIRYDNIEDAVFRDSPLVKTPHFWAVGLGVGKVIWNSQG